MALPNNDDQKSRIDENYESGRGGYDASNLDNAESGATLDQKKDESGDLSAGVRDAEENPGYVNNVVGAAKAKIKGKFWNKKSATGAILSLVLGSGIGFSALFSPSILIVQMKEIMTDKFNTQLASMDVRTSKILNLKIDQSTSGICGAKITIKCKFSTMSEKQVTNFKNAGITVLPEEPNTSLKRTKPTGYSYNGKTITASEFASISKNDPNFRSALKKAYNPKFAGFTGKAWGKAAKLLGIAKTDPKPAANDEERKQRLEDETKNGSKSTTRATAADFLDEDNGCDQACADDKAKTANANIDELGKTDEPRTKAGNAVVDAALDATGNPVAGFASAAGNFLKISGVADSACQAYGAVQAVGYAAKTIRAIQLARYAMAFVKTADMIKAGTAKPEDVAYMGGILTEVVYDIKSTGERIVKQGAATDSFGYKFAALGDTSGNKRSMGLASQFLAGGGLTGELIGISDAIANSLGGRGAVRGTCSFLGNPWVGAGSALVGLVFMLIPGVGQAGQIGKTVLQGAAGVAIQVGLMILPELLKDIVAGTVTEGIAGEASGNAITSGLGKMLSDTVAGYGGNALLTKEQAIAYQSVQNETLARYAEEDRLNLSPLDATNKNTFLGSIVSKLLPTMSKTSSLTGFTSSLGSFILGSFGSIVPTSSAITDAQYAKSLDSCQDFDYVEMGIATDPFCNIIRGIPPSYLNKDPLQVVDELVAAGELNESTGKPTGAYADFVKNCIEPKEGTAVGYSGQDFQSSTGTDCIFSDTNANRYLFWIDNRVEAGMSGEDESAGSASTSQEFVLPLDVGYGVPGESSDWGPRSCDGCSSFHRGVDMGNFPGGSIDKPVYAVAAGTVINADKINGVGGNCTGYGEGSNNVVSIQHANGIISDYYHMSADKIIVNVGDTVTAGQQIGQIGNCGQSYGAHLHFVTRIGDATDPDLLAISGGDADGDSRNPAVVMLLLGVDIMNGVYTDGRQ